MNTENLDQPPQFRSPENATAIVKNHTYFEAHEGEFAIEHPNWWYLISGERVLLCAATPEELRDMQIQSGQFPLDGTFRIALTLEEREKQDRIWPGFLGRSELP